MGRLRAAGAGVAGIGINLVAVALVAVFVLVMFGGGVYRTECTSDNGGTRHRGGLEGDFPYLWSPDDSHCQAHTLTRWVLGKVGVMNDVDR